jgi:sec-independent protein translocase protein TatA
MGSLSPWHWLILLAVVVILFGAKKLPDAARSLGKSMRIFKSEIREMQNEGKPEGTGPAAQSSIPVQSERLDASFTQPPTQQPSPQNQNDARSA